MKLRVEQADGTVHVVDGRPLNEQSIVVEQRDGAGRLHGRQLHHLDEQPVRKGRPPKDRAPDLGMNNGQYRLVKGAESKKDGKRGPKVWLLGADIRLARLRAELITNEWAGLVAVAKLQGISKTQVV